MQALGRRAWPPPCSVWRHAGLVIYLLAVPKLLPVVDPGRLSWVGFASYRHADDGAAADAEHPCENTGEDAAAGDGKGKDAEFACRHAEHQAGPSDDVDIQAAALSANAALSRTSASASRRTSAPAPGFTAAVARCRKVRARRRSARSAISAHAHVRSGSNSPVRSKTRWSARATCSLPMMPRSPILFARALTLQRALPIPQNHNRLTQQVLGSAQNKKNRCRVAVGLKPSRRRVFVNSERSSAP